MFYILYVYYPLLELIASIYVPMTYNMRVENRVNRYLLGNHAPP